MRIGRAVDNEVVLYSAVVSRHHVELKWVSGQWQVENLGSNGTYLDGRKIQSEPLHDGEVIRLARSGPNIKITIESDPPKSRPKNDLTLGLEEDASAPAEKSQRQTHIESINNQTDPASHPANWTPSQATAKTSFPPSFPPLGQEASNSFEESCNHARSPESALICVDCGQPVHVSQIIGPYKILKTLGTANNTFQGWKDKRTFILRTIRPEFRENSALVQQFRQQVEQILELNHGGIPRMVEILEHEGLPYLIYEMVYGQTLLEWVEVRGPLALPQVISWGSEIAEVLNYLHQCSPSMVHQGIKPANIIRPTIPQGNNHLILVNFGQLNLGASDNPSFLEITYASPAQQAGEISPENDLYGLGMTLIFLLTGKEPDTYMRLADDRFILCLDDVPNLQPELKSIIGGLTQVHPEEQITSPMVAIDRLQRLI